MEKILILCAIIMLVSAIFLASVASTPENYIKIPKQTHTHTKAFCNENNFCQDYIIFCHEDQLTSLSPITGAAVQFQSNWKDKRSKEIKDYTC